MQRISFQQHSLIRALSIVLIAALPAACVNSTYDQSKQVALPVDKLKFVNINPAIKMATAYGDRANGEHGTFGTFPANFITPNHTHSGAYHGVVVKGEMTNPFKGEANPPRMPAGSYWFVPANAVHATGCVSSTPCEFYFHAESGFDFKPAK